MVQPTLWLPKESVEESNAIISEKANIVDLDDFVIVIMLVIAVLFELVIVKTYRS